MQILEDPQSIERKIAHLKCEGKTIGLVPTMGALHGGHIELIKSCFSRCEVSVVSIFINPLQFNKQEDLQNYPRTLENDIQLLDKLNVDILFRPEVKDLYIETPVVSVNFGEMETVLEGKYRPGHFKGVGIVVAKLFNLIRPDVAFFGLKDLQQFLLIRQLAKDLSYGLEVVGVPTVREPEGLAMSSRNLRLTEEGRRTAAWIFKGLQHAEGMIRHGELPKVVEQSTLRLYKNVPGLVIEYLQITDNALKRIESYDGQEFVAICVAAKVEGIRLIDNIYLRLESGS